MKKNASRPVFLFLSFFTIFPLSAYSYDFSKADELFKKRGSDSQAVEMARQQYSHAAQQTTGKDLLYAVTQAARCDIYRGEILLPKSDTYARKKIFKQCDEILERISPSQFQTPLPEYYYWKAQCLAFWGEAAHAFEAMMEVSRLLDYIDKGMALDDKTYEGGGIYRIAAGVYGNKKSLPLGQYKPKKALDLIQEALDSDYWTDPFFPNPLSGLDIYDNHYIKASVLIELNSPEASSFIENSILEIESLQEGGGLPLGREPETLYQLKRLQELLGGHS